MALATALLALAASAVDAEQTGASRFALVQVAGASGRALVDVDLDDFVVQEAGANREILDVRVADYPVAIVIDNGTAAHDDFPVLRAAIARFLTRLGPRPIAIVTTAGTPKFIASFEDDREAVLAKLDEVAPDAAEGAAPLRATFMAAEAIRETGALFSTLVVAIASPVELTGTAADESLAPIIDSRAVVHVIANTARIGGNASLLRGIADQTHGNYTTIYSFASYQPALDRLADRLTTELLIEYIVPVGSKAADVKIGVRVPGARVRGLGVAPK
jgi:hypothetical protein